MGVDLQFKRGSAATLPTTAVDGTFYLTTDTERLYVGIGTNMVELNKSIRTVKDIEELNKLPASSVAVGDFYYLTDGNVLAICDKIESNVPHFIQVNPDHNTELVAATNAVSVTPTSADGVVSNVKVQTAVSDSSGKTVAGAFELVPSGNITMTVDGTKITLEVPSGAKYDLSTQSVTDADSNAIGAAISLTNQADANDKDLVNLNNGEYVKVTQTSAGNLTVDLKNSPYVSKFKIAPATGTGKTGFEFTVADAGDTRVQTFDPKVKYGENSEASFSGGNLTLDVYTKEETDDAIDDAIKDLEKTFDAMEYGGTVSGTSDLPQKVKNGTTFKASAGFTLPEGSSNSGSAVSVKTGDLIIATGEEGDDGFLVSPKYDVVPSGDDQTITFDNDASTGISKVSDGTNGSGYKVAEGNKIDVAYTQGDGHIVATVSHETITAPTTTGSAADVTQTKGKEASFTAITAVEEDGYGHVTGITTKTFKVLDTVTELQELSTSATAANNTATVSFVQNTDQSSVGAGSVKISSDNLAITASPNEAVAGATAANVTVANVHIDLEWGTF